MAQISLVFYKQADGTVPVRDWLRNDVQKRSPKALAKCRVRLALLREHGRDLRRPYADYLRDGIYELRAEFGNVNYRLLYFFYSDTVAVVAHGLTKGARVPEKDIDTALARRMLFETDPGGYSYAEET